MVRDTVLSLRAQERELFQREAEALASYMRANMVPADVFDAAVRARDAYRAEHSPK